MCSQSPGRFVTITLDREVLRERGRLGGLATQARHDSHALTARAREGFFSKLEAQVDPAGVLDSAERRRLADHAHRAHMLRCARLSALARRKPKDTDTAGEREAHHAA
jgi:hypothetical protein